MKKGTVGIDEAGRGPLAGPVSVGTVYIAKGVRLNLKGLKDSKQLSEAKREIWFARMKKWQKEGKLQFEVSLISNTVIDKKGIVPAVRLGISKNLKKLNVNPRNTQVLLDGSLKAPAEFVNQKTIIKGDEKISIISLASIAAKVTRDRKMKQLAKKYPQYGFDIHKGYGTKMHRKAIQKFGASEIHRKSFLKGFDK